GIMSLAQKRGVEVVSGRGYFEDSKTLRVETEQGQRYIQYDAAVVAVGSQPVLPSAFDLGNKRIMTSTEALELEDIPQDLLVVGGGYIGMELGTVYSTLGSRVVVVEALDAILGGADTDLVRPIKKYADKNFKEVRVSTKVLKMSTSKDKIKVDMEYAGKKVSELYDKVLISVGRKPNCDDLGLENTKVELDGKGFIKVNQQQRTADPSIYAIGDVVGGAMLAHKASKEARIAVEVMTGEKSAFEHIVIPAVVFTDPELAWCGLTETDAKKRGITIDVAKFPWSASGRAVSVDRPDGLTKLIIEPNTGRILGVGIVGINAGDLISEGVLAVEMGATVKDVAEIVHPHPTFSETIMESADSYFGYSTHAFARKPSKKETDLDAEETNIK
ncbi:MAG: NAD(P)/FAD-dependent oxidoreductase, partial [Chlamydiota bacterium]|nr:NAD(P)/FAD-dependent oxidoreductase [Chlamydiota bacterium]